MSPYPLWLSLSLFVLSARAFTEESTCRMGGDMDMVRCSLPYDLGTCLWLLALGSWLLALGLGLVGVSRELFIVGAFHR